MFRTRIVNLNSICQNMNNITRILVFVSIFTWVFAGCCIFKTSNKSFFKVQDAFYQSWVKKETQKGTQITIILKDVKPNVQFDSIIFRGLQIPVSIENKENNVVLTSVVLSLIPELNDGSVPVNKQDQLLFKVNGKRQFFILEKIRREKMKYY